MKFNVFELRNSSILYLYAQKERIQMDPEYQRMGEVWTLDKRQLLVDSIINDFDIPKLYFHDLKEFPDKSKYDYAIIDGRQRLEAIWNFIDGDYALSESFDYLKEPNIKPAGLTYSELASAYPQIKQLFDATSLSVFVVQTDDIDLIEDMFSRLNEAVPLNAAEKRNAFGGPLPKVVRNIAEHKFFKDNVRISNTRYQHRDLAAKFMYIINSKKIVDTKKVYLDEFFKLNKNKKTNEFNNSINQVEKILKTMNEAFVKKDILLKSAGMAVLYFILFNDAILEGRTNDLSRSKMVDFEKVRKDNRALAEQDITKANYELLEFDRLTQTPNDAYALKFRLELLGEFVHRGKVRS